MRLRIRGGRQLRGDIKVGGAKNAVLKLMAAALMGNGKFTIRNVPIIKDVETMVGVLRSLGAGVELDDSGVMTIEVEGDALVNEAPEKLVREMRASIQVMGPLLARLGRIKVSQPGGCAIGARPIDFHLNGLGKMGARITEEHGFIMAETNRLCGAELTLDFPSVGATENLMMAAALAQGTTIIRGAAKEPEIIDSQNFLNSMGARIRGAGTDIIRVDGVKELGAADYTVIPDRVEAGTYMVASAITSGDITLEPVILEHVNTIVSKLHEAGVRFEYEGEKLRVIGNRRIHPVNLRSLPYPGFPTDMQPQLMSLMSLADGTSIVTETIYSNRFKHVDEMRRMGAQISVEGRTAIVKGVPKLTGAAVEASDLRAGASLVLAGLAAEGETTVEGLVHIDRGYEKLEEKLQRISADIVRIP